MGALSVADRRIEGQGTSEATWQGSGRLDALPSVSFDELVPSGRRLVILAPHPDDEVLGVGGLIALAARSGIDVMVVGVTAGEASHPGSRRYSPRRLADVRSHERACGLERLGMGATALSLAIPDGEVAAHEHELVQVLSARLGPTDVVCATWRLDGHPDHEAVGRAASSACVRAGAQLLEFPVWMWHWASPGHDGVPWSRAVRLVLDADAQDRKRQALAAHESQLVPDPTTGRDAIVPPWAAARSLRSFEVLFR